MQLASLSKVTYVQKAIVGNSGASQSELGV